MNEKKMLAMVAVGVMIHNGPAATSVPTSVAEATAAGYVTMTAGDAWGNCFTYSTLDDGEGVPYAGRVWSDGKAISAINNYFAHTTTVAGAGTGNTPQTLVIPSPAAGGLFVYSGGTHSFRNTHTLDFGTRRVVARSGTKMTHYYAALNLRAACLEVQASSSSPLTYQVDSANSTAGNTRNGTLSVAALVGEDDACMLIQPTKTEAGKFSERLIGDASGYLGTIKVTGNGQVTESGIGHFLELGCTRFGGAVEVYDRGGVSVASGTNVTMRALSVKSGGVWLPGGQTWTIGDLSISDGCVISNLTAQTRIVVTNSLTRGDSPITLDFGGTSIFSFNINSTSTTPAETNVLMTLAQGIRIGEGDVAVVNVKSGTYDIPHWRLEFLPGQDGTTVVAFVHDAVVVGTSSGLTPTSSEKWSDGQAVHGNAEYYNRWYGFSPDVSGGGTYVFPGTYMTTIGSLTPNCEGVVVSNLVLKVRPSNEDAVRLYFYGQNTTAGHDGLQYIAGDVVTVPAYHSDANAYAVFQGYLNRYFRLDSRLEGDGNIRVLAAPNKSNPRFRAEFNNLNTNYTGKVTVFTPTYDGSGGNPATPTLTYSTRFHLWDARNVGGRLDAFAFDGFTVANMSCVVITNDVTFDMSMNRGVSIVSMGRFDVAEGATLSLATPVTYAGELRKEGGGCLALGAKPRFIDGGTETQPQEGTNILNVVAGGVKIAHAEALDGLDVTFAAGTALHIPGGSSNADLEAYGAVMTNALSAVSVAAGQVALVLDDPDLEAGMIARGVMTFATKAEADAAAGLLKPRKLANGHSGSLAVVQTEAGHTVLATFQHSGLSIIIR